MGRLQDVLDRLTSAFRSDEEAEEQDQEPTQAQEQEQTPGEGSDTPKEEVTSEPSESGEMEQVTLALELLGNQVETAVKAIQLIDAAVRDHDTLLKGLAKSETERLQAAIQGGNWYKSLFVASRDGEAVPEDQRGDLNLVQQAPAQQGVGLLGPIIQHRQGGNGQ